MKPLTIALTIGLAAAQAAAQLQVSRETSADTESMLDVYAELTGRTILRPGLFPVMPEGLLATMPAGTNEAIAFLERELRKKEIDVVREGERFVKLLPSGWKDSPLAAQLQRIALPAKSKKAAADEGARSLPAGVIRFSNTPLEQFLEIYAELRERTLLRSAVPTPATIDIRTQTELTRDEAVYAFDVVLVLNGVVAIDDGDKFVQIVPLSRTERVRARAPEPGAGARSMRPETVPVFGAGERASGRQTAGALLAFYAGLMDRGSNAPSEFDSRPIALRVRTRVTPEELAYAIETTFALNGLVIMTGADKSVHLERAAGGEAPINRAPLK